MIFNGICVQMGSNTLKPATMQMTIYVHSLLKGLQGDVSLREVALRVCSDAPTTRLS